MRQGLTNVGCGVSQRLRGCRRGSGGDGDLLIHSHLSLVMYHLYRFGFNMTDGVCTARFDSNPPFINAAFSGLSVAILCCYHLD